MADDELAPEDTPGYQAPKKVDLDTLKNLDANDESLNKWKANLVGSQASTGASSLRPAPRGGPPPAAGRARASARGN